MTKPDLMVKDLLLRYPSLFKNRFEAFTSLMTSSEREWVGGQLVQKWVDEDPVTPETMVAKSEAAATRRQIERDRYTCPALASLHAGFRVSDEKEIHDAKFIAANIDIFATEWTCCDYDDVWAWLWSVYQHGISDYWPVNNLPADIDEEWRAAIDSWFSQIRPPLNNLMGQHRAGGWEALPEYATVFNWVKETADKVEKVLTPEQTAKMERLAAEVVAELKAEDE